MKMADNGWSRFALGAAAGLAVGAYAATRSSPKLNAQRVCNVYRVVLTGGPCGGKSSSLAHVSAALQKRGFNVFAAPEVPTILLSGGCEYPGEAGAEKLEQFEMALLQLQVQMEDSFCRIAASTGRPSVVICDRGLLDVAAYLPADGALWRRLLRANGWSTGELMRRYDLCVHLVTAAKGATEFYVNKAKIEAQREAGDEAVTGNVERLETPEEAMALDTRIRAAWSGHARHAVVENTGSFETKMAETTQHILRLVGAS